MKSVAMVAVLFSILLLVAGTASAVETCLCYHVYADCDFDDLYGEADVSLCVTDHYGQICSAGVISGCGNIVSFYYSGGFKFDGRDTRWMGAGEVNGDPASLYLETELGPGRNMLKGIAYVNNFPTRCLLYGYKQDPGNCL